MDFTVITYEARKRHSGTASFEIDGTTGVLTVADDKGVVTHLSPHAWLQVVTEAR